MDLDFELEDDREKEKDTMTLEIGNMQIEIPEELIEERANLMRIDSREENLEDIKCTIAEFLECFNVDEVKNENIIQEKVINHLISEMELYK